MAFTQSGQSLVADRCGVLGGEGGSVLGWRALWILQQLAEVLPLFAECRCQPYEFTYLG